MRYAIVSDIHANFPAWEAVLADFRECKIEEVVCLGDVVGYGPKPAEVLEAVRAVTGNFVMGNHDAAAVGMMDYSIFNDHAREAIEWTMGQLDEAGKEFLSSVPLAIEAGDVLFVHAEIEEPGRFGYISDLEVAQRNFEAGKHFVTFIGHTHLPKVFEMDIFGEVTEFTDGDLTLDSDSRYIVNVGSVGEPRNPEDLRARYVIYDTETQELEFRRVEFDIPAYRKDLEATALSMRPFFLRTYEFVVEGQEVVVSQGGSLMDMRVGQGSVSLISSGQVASMGQLTGTHPVLASAKPSKAPKIILAVAAVLVICFGLYLKMNEAKEAPVVQNDKAEEGKNPKKGRAKKVARVEETPRGDLPEPMAPEVESDPVSRIPEAPMKADVPDPNEGKVVAAKVDTPNPKPVPPKPKPVDTVLRAWWRMDGKSENGPLIDGGKFFELELVAKGKKIGPIAPDPIPLNLKENTSALKIGVWQEAEPSGEFVLSAKKSFTFEGWFLAGNLKRPVFLLGTRSGEKRRQGWHLDLRPPGRGMTHGQMSFFYDSGSKITQALAEEVRVADSKAHHFGVVWDHDYSGGAGEMRLFLDGQQVAAKELSHAGLSINQVNPLRVGAKGNPDRLALDELRFTARALAPHEFLLRPTVSGVVMTRSDKNNRNSWAVPENWQNDTLPLGDDNAIIGRGVAVQLEEAEIPSFSGSLVLREKATLVLWGDKGLALLPKDPAKLVLHHDARLIFRTHNCDLGPVELVGDAEIWGGASTSGHSKTRLFAKAITGPGKLTINGVNKNTIIFEAANSFTGGFEAFSSMKQAFRVLVRGKKGSLGKGDVIIGGNCSLVLAKDSGGVIPNDVTLSLEGANGSSPQKLVLDAGETVGAFFIDGKDQGVGTFSSKTHPKYIGGAGTLKVTGLK